MTRKNWKKLVEHKEELIKELLRERFEANVVTSPTSREEHVVLFDDGTLKSVMKEEGLPESVFNGKAYTLAVIEPEDISEWIYQEAWAEDVLDAEDNVPSKFAKKLIQRFKSEQCPERVEKCMENLYQELSFDDW